MSVKKTIKKTLYSILCLLYLSTKQRCRAAFYKAPAPGNYFDAALSPTDSAPAPAPVPGLLYNKPTF
jgi:hypothetical protein